MKIKTKDYLKRKISQFRTLTPLFNLVKSILFIKNYIYYYALFKTKVSIQELNIEFSSACNLRCKLCSLDHNKPKRFISKDILEHFLINLLTDKRFSQVEVINLHNGGETLMHPRCTDMLKILKHYKLLAKKRNLKFPQVYLLSNGMLLKDTTAREIISLDVIDLYRFSLDGGTPEAFNTMRGGNWDLFRRNVLNLISLKNEKEKDFKISGISLIDEKMPLNIQWMHSEFANILMQMDSYELRRAHSWGGEVEVPARKNRLKLGCNLLISQLVLLPNGDITVCCCDLNSKSVIGNIAENDLHSIYQSKKRLNLLKMHFLGRKNSLGLCKACESF